MSIHSPGGAGGVTLPTIAAAGVEQILAQTGIAVGIAGTGSVGANGALTLGTALFSATPYTQGCYMFFPAGAAFAASPAGFYLVKMTTATAGTIFNNTFTASGAMPTIPASPTGITDAGPGAYTGDTTARTVWQFTLPANTLGKNGCLGIDQQQTYTNSANTKTFITSFGGSNILNATPTTTSQCYQIRKMFNRGVTNAQIIPPAGQFGIGTATATNPVSIGVDTTASVVIASTVQLSNATDNAFVEFMRVSTIFAP